MLLLGSGCASRSGDVGALPPPPTVTGTTGSAAGTTAPAPTTSPGSPSPTVDRTEVLQVYTAWWRALEGAYAMGDPDAPGLAEYAVDPILARQRASIAAMREQGIVQKTSFALRPRVRYQTERNAEIEDCVRGPANTYHDAVTGRPRAPRGYRNEVPTEDRLLTTLQKRGDQWYVVAATARGEVAC